MFKPKIAIVVSHPIQHFVHLYASFAKNEKIDIKVFFASKLGVEPYFDSQFGKEIKWDSLRLNEFNHEFLNKSKIIKTSPNLDAPELNKKLDEYNPDFIYQYGYLQKVQRRACKWAFNKNVPIIHISDSELRHTRKLHNKIIKRLFLPSFYSKISVFFTVGDANEAYYRHYGVKDYKFIRTGFSIDVDLYEKKYREESNLNKQIRQKYNIPEDNIVCSVVGKLVSWKSQNHIIKAIKLLEKNTQKLTVMIIGSGEKELVLKWKKEADNILKNKIIFTGFVNSEELPAYYAATDIYIHPASREAHSLAISEAAYMKTSIILSDKCGSYGSSDDLRVGENGFVYKFGDINRLAELIYTLSLNNELRKKLSVRSREIVIENQKRAYRTSIDSLINIFINTSNKS